MNYDALKKIERQQVNLWPRPLVEPGGTYARMQWIVNRVDRKAQVVELLAPSGHCKNLSDVIHHYQEAGNYLVLDAQLVIRGNGVDVEPRPWGVGLKTFRKHGRRLALRRSRLRRRRARARQAQEFSRNLINLTRALEWSLANMEGKASQPLSLLRRGEVGRTTTTS